MTSAGAPLSVCIPAHDEERGIARALESLREALQHLDGRPAEILVCANACADGTAAAVSRWAAGHELTCRVESIDAGALSPGGALVTVLETSTPGKPNAWNVLRERARGEVLVFADADIVVHPDALRLLVDALEGHPGALAAGAVVFAPPGRGGLLGRRLAVKMKEFAGKPAPYINGPLYAIRKRAVQRIPEEILHEDAYLSMVVGAERTIKVPGAIAYQRPPSVYRDYYRRRVRDTLADLQLAARYGEQYRTFRQHARDTRTRQERNASLTAGERAFKRWSFPQTWALKLVDRLAERRGRALFRQGRVRWYTIDSTKGAWPD